MFRRLLCISATTCPAVSWSVSPGQFTPPTIIPRPLSSLSVPYSPFWPLWSFAIGFLVISLSLWASGFFFLFIGSHLFFMSLLISVLYLLSVSSENIFFVLRLHVDNDCVHTHTHSDYCQSAIKHCNRELGPIQVNMLTKTESKYVSFGDFRWRCSLISTSEDYDNAKFWVFFE